MQNAWNKQYTKNFSLASYFLFEGGCYGKEEKLCLSQNLNHFSEILAAFNLCGSSIRFTEFEPQREVYYVVSFILIWTSVAFTARGKTVNWLYASVVRCYYFKPVQMHGIFYKPMHAQGFFNSLVNKCVYESNWYFRNHHSHPNTSRTSSH